MAFFFGLLYNHYMNKKQFIDHYVCTFLASYMAGNYDDDCMNGHPGEPYDHQPVEDARFCAERAWKQYYDPYAIGQQLFDDGRGLSDVIGAVEKEDWDECRKGYEEQAQRRAYYD